MSSDLAAVIADAAVVADAERNREGDPVKTNYVTVYVCSRLAIECLELERNHFRSLS